MNNLPQKTFIINLERRQDRLDTILENYPTTLDKPEIFSAVDGKLVKPPGWWKAGAGAWGCYVSHLLILQHCLMNSIDSCLILEDDAKFVDDFDERFPLFMESLPAKWKWAFIGGQSRYSRNNQIINDNVVRCYDIHRTHGYMLNGTETIQGVYKYISNQKDWGAHEHIDWRYSKYHSRQFYLPNNLAPFAPTNWLIMQGAGFSNINGRVHEDREFVHPNKNAKKYKQKFVVVAGPHRSGSSCMAMVCQKLGVSMGEGVLGGAEGKHGGGGEDKNLAAMLEGSMRFPSTDPKECPALEGWIKGRLGESGITVGAKYPHLCMYLDELYRILGDKLVVVSIDRPLEESIDSLDRRSKKGGWASCSHDDAVTLQTTLLEARNKFLKDNPEVPRIHIDYKELCENPLREVSRLASWLGIPTTSKSLKYAADHPSKEVMTKVKATPLSPKQSKTDRVTVVIKTLLRPECCEEVIDSCRRVIGNCPIHVLDDSQDPYKFNVDKYIHTEFDIGVSKGRNRLISEIDTEFALQLDDDDLLPPYFDLDKYLGWMDDHNLDMLTFAVLKGQKKPGVFSDDTYYNVKVGCHEATEDFWVCDIVSNNGIIRKSSFLGYQEDKKVGEHPYFCIDNAKAGRRLALAKKVKTLPCKSNRRPGPYTDLRHRDAQFKDPKLLLWRDLG